MKPLTVRVKARDGTWETVGVDRGVTIVPESVQLDSDTWGPSSASFDLRRDPRSSWPDVDPFAEVDIEEGGVLIWSGRVRGRPSRDGADRMMTVQCEGAQFALDDDIYDKTYIHSGAKDWVDHRSIPKAVLSATDFAAAGQVQVDSMIVLTLPNGTVVPAPGTIQIGVTLDLGPWNVAKRIVVAYERPTTSDSNLQFFARATPEGNASAAPLSDAIAFASFGVTSSGTLAGTFATGYRYVTLFMFYSLGGAFTASYDSFLRLKSIQVFTDTSYESGNVSDLTASKVVTDLFTASPLPIRNLSADLSGIQSTSFKIADFAPGAQTPRSHWTAVDAYQNWMKKIDLRRRPIYAPLPGGATLEMGEFSPGETTDTGSDGGDLFDRALVTGQFVDGSPMSIYRGAGGKVSIPPDPTISWVPAPEVVVPNPGFEVNTTSWSVPASTPFGTFARDTGQAFTGVASGRATTDNTGVQEAYFETTMTGLIPGLHYRATMYVRPLVAVTVAWDIHVRIAGKTGSYYIRNLTGLGSFPTLTWTPAAIDWVADATTATLGFRTAGTANLQNVVNVDNLYVERAYSPLLDRRNLIRTQQLPINGAMPIVNSPEFSAPATIGDTWVGAHQSTPFKGSRAAIGDGAVRDALTGADLSPGSLLARTNEILRMSDRVDPDTGGWGRDGRLVAVSYTPATQTVSMTIDSSRNNLQALLARMAVVVDNTIAPTPASQ